MGRPVDLYVLTRASGPNAAAILVQLWPTLGSNMPPFPEHVARHHEAP